MADEPILCANAFGGEFPVCNEEQKVAIEKGFAKAMEWAAGEDGKAYDSREPECMCTFIARLMNGEASYGDMVTLASDMARETYLKKRAAVALAGIAGAIQGKMEEMAMASDPVMGSTPKKEWVN